MLRVTRQITSEMVYCISEITAKIGKQGEYMPYFARIT